MEKKVYIESLTCIQRLLDSQRFKEYFKRNGCIIVKNPKKADIILFNSCAYAKYKEDLSIKRINQLKKNKGELIVGGCIKGISQNRLKDNFKGKSFSPKEEEMLDQFFPDFKVKLNEIKDPNTFSLSKKDVLRHMLTHYLDLSSIGNLWSSSKYLIKNFIKNFSFTKFKFKSEFYIRICRGCIHSCTFCGIKKAIGKVKSKSIQSIIDELDIGLRKGYKTIIFTGDEVGLYGIDIGTNLPELLDKILSKKEDFILRLESIHPLWLLRYKERFLEILSDKRIESFCCATQSGNDRILNLMKRGHKAKEIKDFLRDLKKNRRLRLDSQIIVGFPSETKEEFYDTLRFLKESGFDNVDLFPYDEKEGSESTEIFPKVSAKEMESRIIKAKKFLKKNKINFVLTK
jgi:tRNA A37 methylthiotransferase MiaB